MEPAPETRQIDRFELQERLGSGGMGVVLRAWDPKLRRPVALKLLRVAAAELPQLRERFRREAWALARLSHPGVVRVFDCGEEAGCLYYVMELLEGQTLQTRLHGSSEAPSRGERPAYDSKELLALFTPLADALTAIHDQGILHRDLKPSNIFVDVAERGPVLTDFGLAASSGLPGLTADGTVMGSLRYMAPEQARGEPTSELSDVYSLGLCMHEAATGRRPFEGIPAQALAGARTLAQVCPVASAAPGLPAPLAAAIDRAVRLDPAGRHPSARAFHEALLEAASAGRRGRGAATRPASVLPRTRSLDLARSPVPGEAGSPRSLLTLTAGRRLLTGLGLAVLLAAAAVAWLRLPGSASAPGTAAPPVAVAAQAPASAPASVGAALGRPVPEARPFVLTSPAERAFTVTLARLETALLAVWTRADGRLGVAAGLEGGLSWRRPALDGQLPVAAGAALALTGKGGRFHLLFSDREADRASSIWASSCSTGLSTWSRPVKVGPATARLRWLVLAGGPPGGAADSLLAVWVSKDSAVSVSWGAAGAGTWSRAQVLRGSIPAKRPAAFLTPSGEACVLWQVDPDEEGARWLSGCRAAGPGQPWSPVARLPFDVSAVERTRPIAVATTSGAYLLHAEHELLFIRMAVARSTDGGRTFRFLGRLPETDGSDNHSLLAAEPGFLWAAWRSMGGQRLMWSRSADEGRSWSRLVMLGRAREDNSQAELVALPGGKACLAWLDPELRVRVERLR